MCDGFRLDCVGEHGRKPLGESGAVPALGAAAALAVHAALEQCGESLKLRGGGKAALLQAVAQFGRSQAAGGTIRPRAALRMRRW